MKTRKPIWLLMTTVFMFGYAIWDLYLLTVSSDELYQNEIQFQQQKVRDVLAIMQNKITEDPENSKLVVDTLQVLVQSKQLGFYVIKQNRMPAATSFTDQESLNFQFEADGQLRNIMDQNDTYHPIATYQGVRVDGKELIVGNFLAKDYITQLIASNRFKIYIDIGVIFLMILSVALYYLWDFIKLRKNLAKGKIDINSRVSKSLEAQVLAGALSMQEKDLSHLREKNDLLTSQVLPSLRKELANVDLAPYDFDCVFVRTDINKYSNLMNAYPHEVLDTVFNEFFFRSAELVNRYGGYCHEVIGDEVIYYFKLGENSDAFLRALACVRDIHFLSAELDQKTKSQYGFQFTVKSALDQGKIRFKKNFHAYSLSGLPFITTVRILSQIDEKDTCQLYLLTDLTKATGTENSICHFRFVKSVTLKGFDSEVSLSAVQDWSKISCQYSQYFKSDRDLIYYFKHIHQLPLHQEAEINDILSGLMDVSVLYPSYDLIDETSKFLTHVNIKWGTSASHKMTAMVLSLVTKIIPPAFGHDQLRDLLWPYLKHSDGRVKANALDALTYYQFHLAFKGGAGDLRKYLRSNRALANAIVNEATRDLDSGVLKNLDWMLKQDSALTRSSALYAIGAIAEHYRKHQPLVLASHTHLSKLIASLNKYTKASDEHERNQALRSLKKAG